MAPGVHKALQAALRGTLGLDRVEPAWRADFETTLYRLSAGRALSACWVMLLVNLPLFAVVDWPLYHSGEWARQPAHRAIFLWRIAFLLWTCVLLAVGYGAVGRPWRDRAIAWGSLVGFPLLGVWFAVVCQTLVTDASIYAMLLMGAAALVPLPHPAKLLLYPLSFILLVAGLRFGGVPEPAVFHVMFNAASAAIAAVVVDGVTLRSYVADFAKTVAIETERRRADGLLHNMLPAAVADRFKRNASSLAQYHPQVSVLVVDIAGFSQQMQALPPQEMIGLLDRLFLEFDEAADRFGVEKIRTLGDAYLAAAGVPEAAPDPERRVADLALRMQSIAARFRSDLELPLRLRIGLHSGPVVAGVIGRRKLSYEVWGDTVNLALQLKNACEPGAVHVSAAVRGALDDAYGFATCAPGCLKARPQLVTYSLLGRRA